MDIQTAPSTAPPIHHWIEKENNATTGSYAVVNKVVPDRKKGTKHSNSNKSLGV